MLTANRFRGALAGAPVRDMWSDCRRAMVSCLAAGEALTSGCVKVLPQVPGFALAPLWLMRSAQPARSAAVDAVYAWIKRLCRSGAGRMN